jgi:hypothetical protein
MAANCGHYFIVELMLKECDALITDVPVQEDGHSYTVWDTISICGWRGLAADVSAELCQVLLDDAPAIFIVKISPQNADVVTRGRQIRALRPSYLEHQRASTSNHSPLPAVRQSIFAAYAEPTQEDMWTDWVRWM